MPELAEVETVRNVLKEKILNKKINNINIIYPKIIENNIKEFKNKLINNMFIDIKRKGKYLIFELDNYYLISHLRMEGKYYIKNHDEEINKHEHIIFELSDFDLRYHDTRKFGRMSLINKGELSNYFINLGPDANGNINPKYLLGKINKNVSIKTLLLDQSIISGLGNIYVDEVLFLAKINPNTKGNMLTLINCQEILKCSKIILDKAIKYKGTTIKSYTSSLGVIGGYQKFLQVHTKEVCPICKNKIVRIKIGGRTTYYCSNCQK